MQNFFTREDVLAYHQQGVQTIRLDSMPILTDLARETLQTLGMEIVTGAAPAAQPASRPAASRPAAAPSGGSSAFSSSPTARTARSKKPAFLLQKLSRSTVT